MAKRRFVALKRSPNHRQVGTAYAHMLCPATENEVSRVLGGRGREAAFRGPESMVARNLLVELSVGNESVSALRHRWQIGRLDLPGPRAVDVLDNTIRMPGLVVIVRDDSDICSVGKQPW